MKAEDNEAAAAATRPPNESRQRITQFIIAPLFIIIIICRHRHRHRYFLFLLLLLNVDWELI